MVNLGKKPVLIVVDFQGGPLNDSPAEADGFDWPTMRDRAVRLVNKCREKRVPVVWVQEVHKPHLIDIGRELDGSEGPHCIEGSIYTELAHGLRPLPGEFHIRKRRYSAFFGTEMDLALRTYQADSVILIGGFTDICVLYTAVDAHQRDYYLTVVTDVVGGSSLQAHEDALEAMHYLQRDALTTHAELIDQLNQRAV